jgi:hypothetical protein
MKRPSRRCQDRRREPSDDHRLGDRPQDLPQTDVVDADAGERPVQVDGRGSLGVQPPDRMLLPPRGHPAPLEVRHEAAIAKDAFGGLHRGR